MFGISLEKFVFIALIAVLVIGPSRLPEYAAKLGRLIREVRRMANGAQEQLKEQLGPDFQDVDWKKLDPRQYDPRRIIREALLSEGEPPEIRPESPVPATLEGGRGPSPSPVPVRLSPGQRAPYDPDAT